MQPTEREATAIDRFASEAAQGRAPGDDVVASAVIMAWPVWAGLPSKKATRRAVARPMLVLVTTGRVLGLRVVPEIFPRGYADPGELELDEPRDGVGIVRSRSGLIATRADLVVPDKHVLIHARAPRQWRGRFAAVLAELGPGTRAGGETVLR